MHKSQFHYFSFLKFCSLLNYIEVNQLQKKRKQKYAAYTQYVTNFIYNNDSALHTRPSGSKYTVHVIETSKIFNIIIVHEKKKENNKNCHQKRTSSWYTPLNITIFNIYPTHPIQIVWVLYLIHTYIPDWDRENNTE